MGDKSHIEWTDATWNPVTGCSKVSQGCKNCYAERLFPRVYGKSRRFTDVRTNEDRLDQPLHWRKPRMIFVNSMSDLFHDDIPEEFINKIFAVMALAPQHIFQILTKRPERMWKYMTHWPDGAARFHHVAYQAHKIKPGIKHGMPDGFVWELQKRWPLPNVWLGVSVEDQATADERIPLLLDTPAAVRWISAEPLLGSINFESLPIPSDALLPTHGTSHAFRYNALRDDDTFAHQAHKHIDWIVAGGESGPHARPSHPDWFRLLRDQCRSAGVPYFFKQWGEWSDQRPENYCRVNKYRYSHKMFAWAADGEPYNGFNPPADHFPSVCVWRVGKKAAGNLLDGRTHLEYPR